VDRVALGQVSSLYFIVPLPIIIPANLHALICHPRQVQQAAAVSPGLRNNNNNNNRLKKLWFMFPIHVTQVSAVITSQ
jgi:hypothetical protein